MALARSDRTGGIALALALSLGASATPLGAQLQTEGAPRTLRYDASRLSAGQFIYQTSLERNTNTTPLGTRTVSVTQSTYSGAAAWLLLETRFGDAVPSVDSLFADAYTLRAFHWASTIGRARLGLEFRGDTAYGATTAPAGRHSIVFSMPPSTLVNGPMLESVLRLLPLQTAWEDSTHTLSVTLNGATAIPTRIAVLGEDRVRVPGGEFDCWIVSVHGGDVSRGIYWVSKRDPIVVRSTLDVPTMGGAQLVSVLVRASR